MSEVTCPVCGASQWATADCYGCGHPLDAEEDDEEEHADIVTGVVEDGHVTEVMVVNVDPRG